MSSSRRGFTLVELMVYLALVTAGVMTLGAIEVGAHRALALQEALIAIDLQSATLLGALRLDVENARRVAVDEDALVVERSDGKTVRYQAGSRVESGGDAPERRTTYPTNSGLGVSIEAGLDGVPLVRVEATFRRDGAAGTITRVHRRTAAPRREVSGA